MFNTVFVKELTSRLFGSAVVKKFSLHRSNTIVVMSLHQFYVLMHKINIEQLPFIIICYLSDCFFHSFRIIIDLIDFLIVNVTSYCQTGNGFSDFSPFHWFFLPFVSGNRTFSCEKPLMFWLFIVKIKNIPKRNVIPFLTWNVLYISHVQRKLNR